MCAQNYVWAESARVMQDFLSQISITIRLDPLAIRAKTVGSTELQISVLSG